MPLVLVIIGLVGAILPSHFVGQHPLGIAFLIVGSILVVIPFLIFLKAQSLMKKLGPNATVTRNRRGF